MNIKLLDGSDGCTPVVVDQFRVQLVERTEEVERVHTSLLAADAQAAGDLHAALNAIGQHCQGSAYVQIITLHQTVLAGGAR